MSASSDELLRIYGRLDEEIGHASAAEEEMRRRDAAAAREHARLRRELVAAEQRAAEFEAQAEDLAGQNTYLKAKLGHQQAQSQGRISRLEQELAAARELAEMMAPGEPAPAERAEPVEELPVRAQMVDELVLENAGLQQELAQARAAIKDLRVTQLVNESLEAEVARLGRQRALAQQIEHENVRLGAKLEQHERAARAWLAAPEPPATMGRRVAALEARAASLQRLLDSTRQVVETQKQAMRDAHALRAKCESLRGELDGALAVQSRLKIQAETFKAHVAMLEAHLADKPVDLSCVQRLEERFEEPPLPLPAAKRSEPDTSSADALVQKLLDTQGELEAARTQLAAAQRELEAKVPQLEIVELHSYDPELQARLDLVDALERENAALRENKPSIHETIEVLNKRMSALKDQAERKAAQAERAVATYQTAAAQTQLAQQSILGWRLEVRSNATCLVHCDDLAVDPALRFFELRLDPATNTYPLVSDTSSVQAYKQQYELWVEQRKSVCGFLAAVKVEMEENKVNVH